MSYDIVHSALRRSFDDAWRPLHGVGKPAGYVPIQWPAIKFITPEIGEWLRFTIIDGPARWAGFGVIDESSKVALLERHTGQVVISTFSEDGLGEGRALVLSREIHDILHGWSVTPPVVYAHLPSGSGGNPSVVPDPYVRLRFPEPSFNRQVGSDGKWYQINTIQPFVFDDVPGV